MRRLIILVAVVLLSGCQAEWEYQSRSIYNTSGKVIGKREYSVIYIYAGQAADHPREVAKPPFNQQTMFTPEEL